MFNCKTNAFGILKCHQIASHKAMQRKAMQSNAKQSNAKQSNAKQRKAKQCKATCRGQRNMCHMCQLCLSLSSAFSLSL